MQTQAQERSIHKFCSSRRANLYTHVFLCFCIYSPMLPTSLKTMHGSLVSTHDGEIEIEISPRKKRKGRRMSGNESAARSTRERGDGDEGWGRGRQENGPRKATKAVRAVKKQKVSESEEEVAEPSICFYMNGFRTEVHTSSKVEPLNKVKRCTLWSLF